MSKAGIFFFFFFWPSPLPQIKKKNFWHLLNASDVRIMLLTSRVQLTGISFPLDYKTSDLALKLMSTEFFRPETVDSLPTLFIDHAHKRVIFNIPTYVKAILYVIFSSYQ